MSTQNLTQDLFKLMRARSLFLDGMRRVPIFLNPLDIFVRMRPDGRLILGVLNEASDEPRIRPDAATPPVVAILGGVD